jgi:hypothetical protein
MRRSPAGSLVAPSPKKPVAEFWCAKAIQDLQDSLARSPLPFTDEQRQRIIELPVAP